MFKSPEGWLCLDSEAERRTAKSSLVLARTIYGDIPAGKLISERIEDFADLIENPRTVCLDDFEARILVNALRRIQQNPHHLKEFSLRQQAQPDRAPKKVELGGREVEFSLPNSLLPDPVQQATDIIAAGGQMLAAIEQLDQT